MFGNVIKNDKYFFVSSNAGDATGDPGAAHGLYFGDTRMLSRYVLTIAQGVLNAVSYSSRAGDTGRIVLLADALNSLDSPPRQLVLERRPVIRDGLAERITLTNYGSEPCDVRLTLDFAADFLDMLEVRGLVRKRRGDLLPPQIDADCVRFRYRGLDDMEYSTFVHFDPAPTELQRLPIGSDIKSNVDATDASVQATFTLNVMPGTPTAVAVFVTASVTPIDQDIPSADIPSAPASAPSAASPSAASAPASAPSAASPLAAQSPASPSPVLPGHSAGISHAEALSASRRDRDEWLATTATWLTDNPLVNETLEQSLRDMRMLLNDFGHGPMPTAGVPWYAALFGRDSLITAMQMLSVRPAIAAATLRTLAHWQGTKHDPHLDEAPGKIMHELRNGELARTKEIPFTPYYGTVDATSLFVIAAGEYWRWTGDVALISELLPSLRRAVAWLDHEADGNGYIAYQRRLEGGLTNQGWKDSDDAIVHRDGSLAKPPIALAEVQAYTYAARLHFAELLEAYGCESAAPQRRCERSVGADQATKRGPADGDRALATEQLRRAEDRALAAEQLRRAGLLKEAFNRDFWVDETQFYAQALDGDRRPVAAVGSNPGHCLWSGIVAGDRADATAQILLSNGMFSGYGIRTLSAVERAYNPLSYHRGTVWPHDNALIAMGLARYGHSAAAGRVAAGLFAAAACDRSHRLPELFGGFPAGVDGPVWYPVACIPQAWAAAAPFLLLQAALGLEPDIPNDRLALSPHLPEGINRIELSNLVLGNRRLRITVERRRGTDVCDGDVEVLVGRPITVVS